jgi:hypothetical protein
VTPSRFPEFGGRPPGAYAFVKGLGASSPGRVASANRGRLTLSATNSDLSIVASRLAAAPSDGRLRYETLARRLIPFASALAAFAIGLLRPLNTDVSWLLTVNDRVLAGAVPYRDVVELNPPASILLYRIPVVVANWLSLRSEIVVVAMMALLIGGMLAYVGKTLMRYRLGVSHNNLIFLSICALVLSVLPFDETAQREHFATIFALPYALVAIARVMDKKIGALDSLFAGAMMGLCVAIKPHFALCALIVSGFESWRSRDLRPLFRVENGVAGVVALLYFAGSLAFFPRFFSDVLPIVRDLYLPVRLGPAELISHILVPIILPALVCWLFRDHRHNAGTLVFLLIAAGFLGAYLIQGKGWSYHAYPVIAYCLFAASWAMQQARGESSRFSPRLGAWLLAAALIAPAPEFFRTDEHHPALEAAILRLSPHPKILALAFRQNLGHPLARNVGVWVGRSWGLWETGQAALMKERVGDDPVLRAKADAYSEADRSAATLDIETQRPDVVLIQETTGFDFDHWIAQSPRLEAAMAHYRLVETIEGVEIYQLSPDAANAGG